MFRLEYLVGAVAFVLSATTANANTITTFDVSLGANATGTVTIDTSLGEVTSADIQLAGYADFTTVLYQFRQGLTEVQTLFSNGSNDLRFNVDTGINPGSLVGFTGGSVTNYAYGPCDNRGCSVGFYDIAGGASGSLTAETPVPAAFPLFATGLAGLGLFSWRRKRKSAFAVAA